MPPSDANILSRANCTAGSSSLTCRVTTGDFAQQEDGGGCDASAKLRSLLDVSDAAEQSAEQAARPRLQAEGSGMSTRRRSLPSRLRGQSQLSGKLHSAPHGRGLFGVHWSGRGKAASPLDRRLFFPIARLPQSPIPRLPSCPSSVWDFTAAGNSSWELTNRSAGLVRANGGGARTTCGSIARRQRRKALPPWLISGVAACGVAHGR